MNIFVGAKKSFFSNLFILKMVVLISFFTTIQTTHAQSSLAPQGWTTTSVTRNLWNYNSYTNEQFSFLRQKSGQFGFYDKEFQYDGFDDGYALTELSTVILNTVGTTYNPESIYAISTQIPDGRTITNYYVNQQLIASAQEDALYIPPKPLLKLQGRENDLSTDLNTEAGFNNYMDGKRVKVVGSTNQSLRANDTGNIKNLEQERTDLQNKIKELDAQIAATKDPALKAKLASDRDAVQEKLETTNQTLQAAQTTNNNTIDTCEHWYSIASTGCMTAVVAVLANMYLKLVSFMLALVGNLFDYSIEIAVNSAEFIDRIGVVEPIWSLIRDLLNMTFIFILLWIAASIIMGKKGYSLRSNVVRVVIVAILINFSLFAAKIAVDASNLLTLQIYQAAKGGSVASSTPTISAKIMDTLGMPTLYKFGDIMNNKTIQGCGSANGTIITIAVFGSIFMIILGLAFLLGAVLFFSRMANIIYLFITSPIWVWGYIMQTKLFTSARNSWESKMRQVVKFPVVYMLFIFVGMFAFVKLVGLRTNQNLSFLTLFCIAEDKSLIGQLPLILNFCLVIWVMLSAIRYGVKEGAGAPGASLGFTQKFNESVSKRFGKWAENTWRRPVDYSVGKTKQLGTGVVNTGKFGLRSAASGASNFVSKRAGRIAENADTPTLLRSLAARLSNTTKDPKVFGKTQKQAVDDLKKKIQSIKEGKAGLRAQQTLEAAINSVGEAPKANDDAKDPEKDMKDRVADFAERTAGIFLRSGVLNDNGNRDKIIKAALEGITSEVSADGKRTFKFNQARMRQKIDDIRREYMPGNGKGNRTHLTGFDALFTARAVAREKAVNVKSSALVTSGGTAVKKRDNSPESLKEDIKKHEEDLKKYPISAEQLDTLIESKPDALKGIFNMKEYQGHIKDIERQKVELAQLESVQEGIDEFGEILKDHAGIARLKESIKGKTEKVDKMKKAVMDQRDKIQQAINKKNQQIDKAGQNKDKDGKKQ